MVWPALVAVPLAVRDAGAAPRSIMIAQESAAPPAAAPAAVAPPAQDESPEAKMARRFPQPVKVGDLIGVPVLDDDDVTLGNVREVVRDPQGKIKLIVSYSKWFGWLGRPVAVPIEVVAILARQIDSLDMQPSDYAKAPTWMPGIDMRIPDNEIIRIAVARR